MNDLLSIAELANNVLYNQTKYFTDKKIINSIFDFTSNNYNKQSIITRLTIIDSYYSTQMNKRYYGIEDIADKICETLSENENDAKNYFIAFAKDPKKGKVDDLFSNKNFGIHKNGNDAGRAVSLLSKYAYYQTKYEFPIYDSLAINIYPLMMKKHFPDVKIIFSKYDIEINQFIEHINKLNMLSGINNYDKLDNLLWLSGKILAGNFSLVFKEKNKYKIFAKKVEKDAPKIKILKNGKTKELSFSEQMIDYVRVNDNNLVDIIEDIKLREFVNYALTLNH
jgi:hypothetical protein